MLAGSWGWGGRGQGRGGREGCGFKRGDWGVAVRMSACGKNVYNSTHTRTSTVKQVESGEGGGWTQHPRHGCDNVLQFCKKLP